MKEAQILRNDFSHLQVENRPARGSGIPDFNAFPAASEFLQIMEKSLANELGVSPPGKDEAEKFAVDLDTGKSLAVAAQNNPVVNQKNYLEMSAALSDDIAVENVSVNAVLNPVTIDGFETAENQNMFDLQNTNLTSSVIDSENSNENTLTSESKISDALNEIPKVQSFLEADQNINAGLEALSEKIKDESLPNAVSDPLVEDVNWKALIKNDGIHGLSSFKQPENDAGDWQYSPRFGTIQYDKLMRLADQNERLRELFLSDLKTNGSWNTIQDKFHDLNFVSGNQNISVENNNEDLHAELSNLIKSSFRIDTPSLNKDVWVQQIWPLQQNDSIFDGDKGNQIPYNPERDTVQSPEPEGVDEWGESFEAGWADAESAIGSQPGINSFAGEVQGNAGAMSGKANDSPFKSVPEGEKLFNDIIKQMNWNVDNGNYQMSLALHPENLGHLRMNVSLQGDRLDARILVESESVKNLMDSKLDELIEKLNLNGVSVNKLEIVVQSDNSQTASKIDDIINYSPAPDLKIENSLENHQIAYFNRKITSLSKNWVV